MMDGWAGISLVAALVSLTNVRWGQFFLGEPLVVGLLTGWAVRDVPTGVWLGAVIQFMWVNSVPVGVKVQSNYTVMTLLSVLLVDRYGHQSFPLAFVCGYVAAMLCRQYEVLMRKLDNTLVDGVQRRLGRLDLTVVHLGYMAGYTVVLWALVYGSVVLAHGLLFRLLPFVPLTLLAAFAAAWDYLPLYALSLFYGAVNHPRKPLYILVGAALASLVLFFGAENGMALLLTAVLSFVLPLAEGRVALFRRKVRDA